MDKIEQLMLAHIRVRGKGVFGVSNTIPYLRRVALLCAKKLGNKDFKASRNFLNRFAKRHRYKWSYTTTDRQQSIESFLQCWNVWIHSFRTFIGTLGFVTPDKYISSINVWNCDEFGLEPLGQRLKHMVTKSANMINSQQLLSSRAGDKRCCTVTGIVPKSGFNPNCYVQCTSLCVQFKRFNSNNNNNNNNQFRSS